jgi:hypothetical protein
MIGPDAIIRRGEPAAGRLRWPHERHGFIK